MPPHRRSESGFTLVELMVAAAIIAILMGIGIAGVRSARSTGSSMSAVATVHAYADAVDQFAREHHGRYPGAPGSADWPASPARALRAGPVTGSAAGGGPYLAHVPESVQDGSIVIGPTTSQAGFRYVQLGGGTGYEFTLHVPGRPDCAVRGGSRTGASSLRDCSTR